MDESRWLLFFDSKRKSLEVPQKLEKKNKKLWIVHILKGSKLVVLAQQEMQVNIVFTDPR